MSERIIRAIADKTTNRFAIHDVNTGELIHLFQSSKELAKLSPEQLQDQETEAIRDFLVNGTHEDEGEVEPGW